ncbi:hypothetical protein OMP40_17445 [Cohnella rhizosphaerae]|uniref:Uncharacterized protein n=1 Tax=Cohnella rhizosphaerae TaxID=1457232 RepID=A0A9X4KUB8_9BACL|nr:hypothetical protein [Cohnella rhizosphaerae]MDG0810950.1 hypothetical protein [Cohnella rhizosphaerae]
MEAKAAGTTVVKAVYGAFETSVNVTVVGSVDPENPSGPDLPSTTEQPSIQQVAVPGGIATAMLDRAAKELDITLDSAALAKALDAASESAGGNRTVLIELPETSGVDSYKLKLPAGFFAAGDGDRRVSVKTALGTVTIPSDMLQRDRADEGAGGEIAIRVSPGDRSRLDPSAAEAVGDRPLIDLVLFRNGVSEEWRNPQAKITVAIPYAPSEEELRTPGAIIAYYVDAQGRMMPIPNGRYDSASGAVVFATDHFSRFGVAFSKKELRRFGAPCMGARQHRSARVKRDRRRRRRPGLRTGPRRHASRIRRYAGRGLGACGRYAVELHRREAGGLLLPGCRRSAAERHIEWRGRRPLPAERGHIPAGDDDDGGAGAPVARHAGSAGSRISA